MRIRDAAELRARFQKETWSNHVHQNSGTNVRMANDRKQAKAMQTM